jgi:4-amino-4-deoxy-L-arabinose transferase-like glycosyltransferase
MNRTDLWRSLGLFGLTVLSRIPFRSRILYHWDSVNFGFAMQKFDVAAEQPHSPGYIGYVWLCRLVDVLFHDPQATMVWLSILGSGLAVVAMYLLGRAMFGRRTGLVAALFLASSPLFWFYGEIALPHAVDTFLVIFSAWLLYEVLLGRVWAVVPAAASLAVAGGMRQQTPVFLGLLALFAGVRFLQRIGWGRGWRWVALAVVAFGLLCAGWFFPLIHSAGGLARYFQVFGAFSERFDTRTSVFLGAGAGGLAYNLRRLGMYTLYGWGATLLPLAVYGIVRVWRRQSDVQWERALFLVTWVLPPLFFYTLIHMGQQGLVFVFLPVLLLVSAQAGVRLAQGRGRTALAAGTALLVVVNSVMFAALPEYPLGGERFKVLSWDTLRNNDAYYQERFDAIRGHFPAGSTVVIAGRWRHVEWYLPEYQWLPFSLGAESETGEGQSSGDVAVQQLSATDLGLNEGVTVVLFDVYPEASGRAMGRAATIPLGGGETMSYLHLGPGEALYLGPEGIGVGP